MGVPVHGMSSINVRMGIPSMEWVIHEWDSLIKLQNRRSNSGTGHSEAERFEIFWNEFYETSLFLRFSIWFGHSIHGMAIS